MATFQETAKDLFGKGYSAASDIAAKAKIKMQLLDQSVEYDNLMKKLGNAVYEEVKRDSRYVDAYPELFKNIEEVIERKQALEDELARMNAEDDDPSQPIDIVPIDVEDDVTADDSTEKDAE